MLAPIDILLAAPPPDLPFGTPFDLSQFELPADHQLPVLYLALGIVLLLLGRRLFWLSLGLAGFVAGLVAMTYVELPPSSPSWTPWAVAAVFGLLGGLLAVFVQRVVVGAVGFVTGGLGALWLAETFAWPVDTWVTGNWGWLLVFCIGGGVMAALAGYLFEAALIVLSALAGAALVVVVTRFDAQVDLVLFPALALLGMLVQTGTFGRRERRRDRKAAGVPSTARASPPAANLTD